MSFSPQILNKIKQPGEPAERMPPLKDSCLTLIPVHLLLEPLDEALSFLRPGDSLVVWRLDRLGRSLKHLIETITDLSSRNIGFKSTTENIDTTTSGGKLIFHIFGAPAEFERNLIKERTQVGLEAARARGKRGGRPKSLNSKKAGIAKELYKNRQSSASEICTSLGISRATLYRYVKTVTPQET